MGNQSDATGEGSFGYELGVLLRMTGYGMLHPKELLGSMGPTLNELTRGKLGKSFDPKEDIGDLSGKVILVTGGNAGLGKETILQLAHHNPKRIYMAARSASKARDAISSIKSSLPEPLSSTVEIKHLPLDLSSLASVKEAAEHFLRENDRLHLLILNAGLMAQPAVRSSDGYEIQLAVNHIGHFLLTQLLLPVLRQTATAGDGKDKQPDVRVVTVSSVAHNLAPSNSSPAAKDNFMQVITSTDTLLNIGTFDRYAFSKAANILFAAELARRHGDVLTSVSVHPGVVASNLYSTARQGLNRVGQSIFDACSGVVFRSVASGARNQLWAAAGAEKHELTNGGYYAAVMHGIPKNRFATDADLGERLWKWTEGVVAKYL